MSSRFPVTAFPVGCSLLVVGAVFFSGGCGSGGGQAPFPIPSVSPLPIISPSVPTEPFVQPVISRITVEWPARSRAIAVPASAQSFRATIRGGGRNGEDVAILGERPVGVEAQTASYTASSSSSVDRAYDVTLNFYSQSGQKGAVSATATLRLILKPGASPFGFFASVSPQQGSPSDEEVVFTLSSHVARVTVLPNQTVRVAQAAPLLVEARDAQANVLAVPPGAESYDIQRSETEPVLFVENGVVKAGGFPGRARVIATVDGVQSDPVDVTAVSDTVVILSPSGADAAVSVGKTLQFSALVGGSDAQNQRDVTWRVVSPGGGAISTTGLYTPPETGGTYRVEAVSQYDPSSVAFVDVAVQSGGLSGTIR